MVDKLRTIMVVVNSFTEWLKGNAWALIIVGASIISSYALYGYQITELRSGLAAASAKVELLEKQQQDNNLEIQIALTKITTDLEYIKARLGSVHVGPY